MCIDWSRGSDISIQGPKQGWGDPAGEWADVFCLDAHRLGTPGVSCSLRHADRVPPQGLAALLWVPVSRPHGPMWQLWKCASAIPGSGKRNWPQLQLRPSEICHHSRAETMLPVDCFQLVLSWAGMLGQGHSWETQDTSDVCLGLKDSPSALLSTPGSAVQSKTLPLTTLLTRLLSGLHAGPDLHCSLMLSPPLCSRPIFSPRSFPCYISCTSNPVLASASQRNWTEQGGCFWEAF